MSLSDLRRSASVAILVASLLSSGISAHAKPPESSSSRDFGTFGFDMSGMDQAVRPGDDFYSYANGHWQARTTLSPDQSAFSMMHLDFYAARARVAQMLAQAARHPGSKAGDMYASFLDERTIDAKGIKPLETRLAAIHNAKSRRSLATEMAALQIEGVGGLFDVGVGADPQDTSRYAVSLFQAGTGMPDRSNYLADNPTALQTRTAYASYISTMLALVGEHHAEKRAKDVIAFETVLAASQLETRELRDAAHNHNVWKRREFDMRAPGLAWEALFSRLGLNGVSHVIVTAPASLKAAARAWRKTPTAVLRDWLLFRTIDRYAPYLSQPYESANFAFHGTLLEGQAKERPRTTRAVALVTEEMRDAVGREYVAQAFKSETRAAIATMVEQVRAAFRARLRDAAWLSPHTRARALAKLDRAKVLIGYPDRWRNYATLEVKRGDLVGNVARAEALEYRMSLSKLGQAVDRGRFDKVVTDIGGWSNPQLVNIGFPAAALQAPVFDPQADPAVNFGAFGAIVGHEFSHLFDDQGRKFNESGQYENWWASTENAQFDARANRLTRQYDAYSPLPGVTLDGARTLGENLADLVGLEIALDAYHQSLGGRTAPVIDGLSGDQRFFLSFGQMQRIKQSEPALRAQVLGDVHVPNYYRVMELRNIDAWYDAFGIAPTDKLYLPAAQRVRLW